MAKYHDQRDQYGGVPHPRCLDVRREQSWMHELPTWLLFFHPSCVPFTFLDFFFILLLVAQRVRAYFV